MSERFWNKYAYPPFPGNERIDFALENLFKKMDRVNVLLSGPPGSFKRERLLYHVQKHFKFPILNYINPLDVSDVKKTRDLLANYATAAVNADVLFFIPRIELVRRDCQYAITFTLENFPNLNVMATSDCTAAINPSLHSMFVEYRHIPVTPQSGSVWLAAIAREEKWDVPDNIISAAIIKAEGNMRRALSLVQGCAPLKREISIEDIEFFSITKATELFNRAITTRDLQTSLDYARANITDPEAAIIALTETVRDKFSSRHIGQNMAILLLEVIGDTSAEIAYGANAHVAFAKLVAKFIKVALKAGVKSNGG